MRSQLTIAIPTFNRADKLKECLKRVIKYSAGKNVEILVSDNASSDNTLEIVMEMQKQYPQIEYFRNNENLGFDGNFLNCFEKATGEYIWLLSDDDILMAGAVESVLKGCEKYPVCMHLNSSGIKSEEPFILGKPRFKENGYKEYTDKNIFIENIGIYCTFLSSLIFKLDYVREIENKEQYFKTNILQSHILFEIMRNDGLYIINTFNCIAARGNKSVHYDILKTWVKNYSELFLTTAVKCGFDKKRMCEVLKSGLDTTVYEYVIFFRQTCVDEMNWDRECIWPYINLFPELINKYRKAIYSSKKELILLSYVYRAKRKLYFFMGK